MDLKNLQCFVAVAEHLNFSRAAQSLYISQPSLSIRINGLEEELQTQLFYRTHQCVFLTEAGTALLPEVREILRRIDALPELARSVVNEKNELKGQLSIGMDYQEARSDLPFMLEAFAAFQKVCPHVELCCSGVDYDDYERKLLNNEYDICMMVMWPNSKINPLFSSIPLYQDTMVLFAKNPGGATAEELLQSRDLLIMEHGERWNRMLLNFLSSKKLKVNTRMIRGALSLSMNLCSGKTVAFLPYSFAITLDDAQNSIIDFYTPDAQSTFTAIWNKMNTKPAVQRMINELTSAVEGMNGRPL